MRISVLGLILLISAPLAAQDYLGAHLDTIREDALRRHQQDMSSGPSGSDARATTRARDTSRAQVSMADRQAAWSRNKAEYRRRMLSDGPAAADRWLDEQALAMKGASAPQPAPKARNSGKKRADMKNCKKVRYVNRATPGFGGAAMTMSRVAVCDD